MLRLRPYKKCDAEKIASWILGEKSFYQWSAGILGAYPFSGERLQTHYEGMEENDAFWVMVAFDEEGPVGQLIMRFLSEDKEELRFGFIVVDASKRGQGYGKEMLQLALQYAFESVKVSRVSLGVFANNPSAYHCYRSVGFQELPGREVYTIQGEPWECIMMEAEKTPMQEKGGLSAEESQY